tara:strand:- start:68 stop:532 length:465 start_codon:yes stop_codon:yes gene_type:complete
MSYFSNKTELRLGVFTLFLLFALLVIEVGLPLIPSLKGSFLGEILVSEGLKNVLSGLLVGFISAYIFYFLMSYIPRRRSENKKLEVLNSLLASILSAYKRCGIFSHEVALPYVDKSVLNEKWLTSHLEAFKNERSKYVALLMSTSVADSRLEDI